jgi:DNA modification methylase
MVTQNMVTSGTLPALKRNGWVNVPFHQVLQTSDEDGARGHSALFPISIPELLLTRMRHGDTILDPYSGSMTTGRAAYGLGIRSVSIELHKEYCDLGLRLLEEENKILYLFPDLVPLWKRVV